MSNVGEITRCRVCFSPRLELVLDYGQMPLAGAFLLPGQTTVRYPLRLGWCAECGLMQTLDRVMPDLIFQDYSYVASSSPALVRHFEELASAIMLLSIHDH